MTLLTALLIAHIATTATWFGHKLLVPGDVRASLNAGVDAARLLLPRLVRAERLGIASGLATVATGVALVLDIGGFSVAPARIHIGLGLVLVMFSMGAAVARPASRHLRAAVDAADLDAAARAARHLLAVLYLEQALWLAILVLMVWR